MRCHRSARIVVSVYLLFVLGIWLFPDQGGGHAYGQDSLEKDYSDQLQTIAPKEVDLALETFEIIDGLRIELIASEPMVVDPVAITFDEYGRAYVVEMRGYSERANHLLGRIKRLEDVDRDGRFDKSTVFADTFRWPTAVVCARDGILVGDAPDIVYLKDTNDDGRADFRQVVFTGLGTSNVQQLPNSFQWGLDNRIYGASGGNGGRLSRVEFPRDSPLDKPRLAPSNPFDVRGRDFRINPLTLGYEAIAGGTQFGMTFDQWGRRYVCSNSDHCQQIVFEDRYAARNKQQKIGRSRVSIAPDGPAAEVFRASPIEPWRKVRTRLRVQGLVRGPIEGGGRAAGYFTSATGICCYDGDWLPPEFVGNLFVGDVGSNLVHRKSIVGDEIQKQAIRMEQGTEFLRSSDNWFRPVQMANAPDGSLILLDMYRETIEHPASLPPLIKKHLDLNSGNKRGRIYRVAPRHGLSQVRVLPGDATLAQLVNMLGHANGWHRQTAARVLLEKSGSEKLLPAIVQLIRSQGLDSAHPVARTRSMYLLSDMDVVHEKELASLLRDPHPQVRIHALRLAEMNLTGDLEKQIGSMTEDDDHEVRFQVALTVGEFASGVPDAIARLAATDGASPWMQMALASSAFGNRAKVIQSLVRHAKGNERLMQRYRPLILEMADQLARQATVEDWELVGEVLKNWPDPSGLWHGEFVSRLLDTPGQRLKTLRSSLHQAGVSLDQIVQRATNKARKNAFNQSLSARERAAAIVLLRMDQPDAIAGFVDELLGLAQPPAVQRAVLEVAGKFEADEIGESILGRFRSLNPDLRSAALQVLLAREVWVNQLLVQIESGNMDAVLVDAASRQRLVRHRNGEIQARAKHCFGAATNSNREKLVQRYMQLVKPSNGDVTRGRVLFRKSCVACHRLENVGNEIGPNLVAFANRGVAAMITHVLDPNREVDPRFLSYQVLLADGRTLLGVISNETATTIGLQDSEGKTTTILRGEIEAMQSTTVSLMPENFENDINPEAMADLLSYLLSQGS